MKSYTNQHKYYCGADLHAKSMYICIIDKGGAIVKHKNIPSDAYAFLHAVDKYREDIVVSVECMYIHLCRESNLYNFTVSTPHGDQYRVFILNHSDHVMFIPGGQIESIETVETYKPFRGMLCEWFHVCTETASNKANQPTQKTARLISDVITDEKNCFKYAHLDKYVIQCKHIVWYFTKIILKRL